MTTKKTKKAAVAPTTTPASAPPATAPAPKATSGATPGAATPAPAPAAAPPAKKKVGGRKPGSKALTTSQKAEAVTLWRSGKVTQEDLAKRFGKRPETFGRLFKRMGIAKGDAVAEKVKELAAAAEEQAANDVKEALETYSKTKKKHIQMADALAMVTWGEIVQARKAGLDLGGIKETMQTLKLASDILANCRIEIFELLDVETLKKKQDDDDLPELLVKEMTVDEIAQVQRASKDDGMDDMPELPPEDDDELDAGLS